MLIERLVFRVIPRESAKDFLKLDAELWDPWLRKQQGFVSKTGSVRDGGKEVSLTIFWRSREDLETAAKKVREMNRIDAALRSKFPGFFRLLRSELF